MKEQDRRFIIDVIGGHEVPTTYTMEDAETDKRNMALDIIASRLYEMMHEYMEDYNQ